MIESHTWNAGKGKVAKPVDLAKHALGIFFFKSG